MTQGSKANQNGKVLETTVEGTLKGKGYEQPCMKLTKKERLNCLKNSTDNPKQYARQVYIGQGIYGTDIEVDFYIFGCPIFTSGLIIECKWQQVPGSVDEKFPYLNLNIQHCYQVPTIVLIDGGGTKPGAITWLQNQVKTNPNLLAVHDVSSFMKWANNNL